jgi:protein farnesyltransferase subunit beta
MSTDNNYPSPTSEEQHEVEMDVLRMFGAIINKPNFDPSRDIVLYRNLHVKFLTKGLDEPLKSSYISLEASRPWIIFWILHALDLLGERATMLAKYGDSIPNFLSMCQNMTGGFGGGPGQISHLATTYASVASLVTIGTPSALSVIDREAMKKFLLRMKDPVTGGFRMHDDGEIDIRGTYCAIAVASILWILDDDLTYGVGEYVQSCQTYEGGIAGEPGMEAHGGYSYCGLAALAILGIAEEYLDLDAFQDWLCRRQMCYEGGFQGRANKLVDSCYTFWQGACFPLLAEIRRSEAILYNQGPAQLYVLLACQSVIDVIGDQSLTGGGLRDKPGKNPDFYHSCYALSGLAALQYPTNRASSKFILGSQDNQLERNCIFYNCTVDRVREGRRFFQPPHLAKSYTENENPELCTKVWIGHEGNGVANVYEDLEYS